MNSFFKKGIFVFLIAIAGFLSSVDFSNAQTPDCDIVSANFRPIGVINNYNEDYPPTVYLDVRTTDCDNVATSLKFVFYTVEVDDPGFTERPLHQTILTVNSAATTNPLGVNGLWSKTSDFSMPISLGEKGSLSDNIGGCLMFAGYDDNTEDEPVFIIPLLNNLFSESNPPDCLIYLKIYQYVGGPNAVNELIYSLGAPNNPQLVYSCDGDCYTNNFFVTGDFCFGPNDPQNINNGLVEYLGSCPLQTSTISITSFGDGLGNNGPTTTEYSTEPLAPLPGFTGDPNLGQWLESLFTILIVIAGILALIMIIVGGITYITSESFGGKGQGKAYIINAIIGLVLALGAWVILNTINPNLAEDLNLNIPNQLLTVDQGSFSEFEDELVNGQSFVLAGTFDTPQTSPGLSQFLDNINQGNQITSIAVNTSSNSMVIASNDGANVTIPVTGLGLNGVSEEGQGVEGDKKTPKGSWQITSDIRISQNQNDAQTPAIGNFNMGPAFIGTNISTPSGTIRGIGIHGNKNNTPGATMGCVRIKNDDVLALARKIVPGVTLTIN